MQGNIILSGLINTPKLNGNLIIDDLKYSELNIFVKDIILNLKNSVAYLNITNGQIADYNFDLVSQIRYVSNKIIFDFLM